MIYTLPEYLFQYFFTVIQTFKRPLFRHLRATGEWYFIRSHFCVWVGKGESLLMDSFYFSSFLSFLSVYVFLLFSAPHLLRVWACCWSAAVTLSKGGLHHRGESHTHRVIWWESSFVKCLSRNREMSASSCLQSFMCPCDLSTCCRGWSGLGWVPFDVFSSHFVCVCLSVPVYNLHCTFTEFRGFENTLRFHCVCLSLHFVSQFHCIRPSKQFICTTQAKGKVGHFFVIMPQYCVKPALRRPTL